MIVSASSQRDKPVVRAKVPTGLLIALVSLLFATFISPQVSLWGHGLRTALPLFILFGGLVLLWRGKVVLWQLERHALPIIAGLVFAGTSSVRYLFEPSPTVLQSQGFSAIVCVALWITMIVLRTSFPEALEPIRWLGLLTLGISLGMGIPLLLQQPGIGRLTMGNPMADVYAAELYPKGVTNYSWYTPLSIAFPALANWLLNNSARPLMKMLGWGLLLAAVLAIILSTFTMAMVLVVAGAAAWLVLAALTARKRAARALAVIVLIVSVLAFPALYLLGSTFEATEFQVQKATRLFTGITEIGLLDVDETGRTVMFVNTMHTFLKYPLFGAWGLAGKPYYVGGHSSWADMLAWQGLFGMALWLVFLSPSWKRGRHPWSVEEGMAGGTLSWMLLGVGGILNPTLNSSIGLLLIWLYDENAFWRAQNKTMPRQR